MFWSDVISQEPEVYHLLPKNLICLHWDYASNVSSERLTRLANSGAGHLYVCPGVQGWNQLINKYHEAYENISRMARYGHECHAMGLLNTDWGDYGHINHPDFSRIGMIYGAAFSWNADILPEEEINRQISVLEFGDASGNSFPCLIFSAIRMHIRGAPPLWYRKHSNCIRTKKRLPNCSAPAQKAMRMLPTLRSMRSAPFCTRKPAPSARRTVR